MYNTVREYFEKEHQDLVGYLDNSDPFWQSVAANTISDAEILDTIHSLSSFATRQAALAILNGRLDKKISRPG